MQRLVAIVFLTCFLLGNLSAQGIFTEYGQNRIQYKAFEWKTISHENIEIVYYGNDQKLAAHALEMAIRQLGVIENYLSYKYGGTMQILVFSNLSDYRQSNIGYNNPQMNSGGYLMIPNDESTVYFNGDYHYLKTQLTRAVCDIIMREMIYGGSLQDRFERVRSAALPVWFLQGLSQFLAESWSAETENRFRDAMSRHLFDNFNLLSNEDATLAGVGIWRYLVETYGAQAISTVVFIARYTHSAEAAIYFHTKRNMKEFLKDWKAFYQIECAPAPSENLPRGKASIPGRIAGLTPTAFSLSPDGNKVAIVTNDKGKFTVWIYDIRHKTVKHIYEGGRRVLNQIADYQFPKVKWNPGDKSLCILTYEHDRYQLLKLQHNKAQQLPADFSSFSGINDFGFNANGTEIVFSGVKNGEGNIWILNLNTREFSAITNDEYHDKSAIFGSDGSILFVSNRPVNDSVSAEISNANFNLFQYRQGNITALTKISGPSDISDLISYNHHLTGFISDQSGLCNAWIADSDSIGYLFGQTNYQRGILGQAIAPEAGVTAEMLLLNGRYVLFSGEIPENPLNESVSVSQLPWKRKIQNLDSFLKVRNLKNYNGPDFQDSMKRSVVDSTHGGYSFQTGFPRVDYLSNSETDSVKPDQNSFKKGRFFNSLQPEFLLSQSDNRQLGSYMQSNRIRHEALRNPVVMPYVKVSLSDVLRNYLIEAGVRASLDLMVTDYTTRFSLLKYRTDHDFSLSRHSRKFEETGGKLMQNLSVQGIYTASHPINENLRISLSAGIRRELLTVKGSEQAAFNIPDKNDVYGTGKFECIYDNTTALGLNRLSGIRLKGGLDMNYCVSKSKRPAVSNLYIDARFYLPVWKAVIWASRITSSYSLSQGKVAYYLGAVENWTSKTQFANPYWLNGSEYVFQQWVCNLRGFSRGIRVGSNFTLLNTEIRLPLVLMISHKPLESEFLKNFTITGFTDIGTAFIGKSPADPNNPFNTVYYNTPNYNMAVTAQRNPWVYGVGWGVRTRLLGYYIKYDRAVGYADRIWNKPMNYLSLGFDF